MDATERDALVEQTNIDYIAEMRPAKDTYKAALAAADEQYEQDVEGLPTDEAKAPAVEKLADARFAAYALLQARDTVAQQRRMIAAHAVWETFHAEHPEAIVRE